MLSVGGTGGRTALLAVLLALLLAACTGAPAPPPTPPPPSPEPEPTQVVVAVDELGAGFNPHLLAHQSTVTTALAGLALPSVFRPDPTGNLQLDRTVATSAAGMAPQSSAAMSTARTKITNCPAGMRSRT